MRIVICCFLICICLLLVPTDTIPPRIVCDDTFDSYVGESVVLRSKISVLDNMTDGGGIKVSIDTQFVNINRCGTYPVTVYATDAQGNVSTKNVTVNIVDRPISKEKLNEMTDEIIGRIISETMSDEEKCRSIYSYVKSRIAYREVSKEEDSISAAYHGLVYGYGDCYTSYAVTGALLDACGIENIKIERAVGFTPDTHVWNLVRVNGEWYHLDTTRLYPGQESMGCLMTDEQLEDYCKLRGDTTGRGEDYFFYLYDKSSYPDISKKKITEVGKGAYKEYTPIS